jgi:8-amino-7-oxononanoate synthase
MPLMESPPNAQTVIDGRRYTYFVGTGYLGLHGRSEVIRAACEAAERYGIGSATSRAGFGNTPPTLNVERCAAELFAVEDAFYYVSGYVGNSILALALKDSCDAVFVDERSHYSILEAALLTHHPVHSFRHRDPADLEAKLHDQLGPQGRPIVMSDGVFATLGTIAPVAEYRAILRGYPGACLVIDDAHAVGVLGENGRGTFEHAGLLDARVNDGVDAESRESAGPRLFFSGTLSKAVGGFGGVLPGSRRFVECLKAGSHYYNGASALPAPVAAATACALELIAREPGLRRRLWDNVRRVKSGLRRLGLETDDTPVPIVSLTLGSADRMRRIQGELMRQGILIAYMGDYSGVGPEGMLRIAVFATHTDEMIDELLETLGRLV